MARPFPSLWTPKKSFFDNKIKSEPEPRKSRPPIFLTKNWREDVRRKQIGKREKKIEEKKLNWIKKFPLVKSSLVAQLVESVSRNRFGQYYKTVIVGNYRALCNFL